MGVGAVVVEHDVQLLARIGLGDLLAERQEFDVAVAVRETVVALPVATSKAATAWWCRGEGSRGAPLGQSRSQRQDRLGAVQRLDLGLLVHA
jgi:hypothetical protein